MHLMSSDTCHVQVTPPPQALNTGFMQVEDERINAMFHTTTRGGRMRSKNVLEDIWLDGACILERTIPQLIIIQASPSITTRASSIE